MNSSEAARFSSEIKALQKNVDMYSLRLRRTRNRITDLEMELGQVSPRKRANSSLFDTGKARKLRIKTEKLEIECSEAEKTVKFYGDLFKEFGFPELVKSKKKQPTRPPSPSRRAKSELSRIDHSAAGSRRASPGPRMKKLKLTGPLPPISITKITSRRAKTNSQFESENERELFMKYFNTTDLQMIGTLVKQARAKNARLKARKAAVDDEKKEIEAKQRQIFDKLAEKRRKRMVKDLKEILSDYRQIADHRAHDRKDTEMEHLMMRKSVTRMATLLDIENTSDSPLAQTIANIRKKFDDDPSLLQHIRNLRDDYQAKVSFTVVNAMSSRRLMLCSTANSSQVSLLDETEENVMSQSNLPTGVPMLSLNSISGAADFMPQTRSNRRAFSVLGSGRSGEPDTKDDVNEELTKIGRFLGNIYVERFSPSLHKMTYEVKCDEDIYPDLPRIESSEKTHFELYSELFKMYTDHINELSLLLFSVPEIRQIYSSFLEFIAFRDHAFGILKEKFSMNVLMQCFLPICTSNWFAAFWIAYDLTGNLVTTEDDDVQFLYQRLVPSFNRMMKKLRNPDVVKKEHVIGMLACMGKFMESDEDQSIGDSIVSIIGVHARYIVSMFDKLDSVMAKRGMTALFRLGKSLPYLFHPCLSLENCATSLWQRYIEGGLQYQSCVQAACDFLGPAIRYCDEECKMWHTAFMFHLLQANINRQVIRNGVLLAIVSTITTIVANRQPSTVDQLSRLHFLRLLINQFELEQFLAAKPTALPNPAPSTQEPTRMSYLDIPKLSIPQIPSLNLENPKLQLHFRPKGESNLRLSMSITGQQYFSQRKNYPVYISKEFHVAMIQLFFALVIDHSLHKLDINFCDPFPEVNRKPNVLFTLMQHMEGAFNQSVIDDLTAAFQAPPERSSRDTDDFTCFSLAQLARSPGPEMASQYHGSKLAHADSFRAHIEQSPHQPFKSTPNFIAFSVGETSEGSSRDMRSSRDQLATGPSPEVAQFQDYERLLRLTVPAKFNPEQYTNGTHIASGAFGAVMAVRLDHKLYAVKILEKSKNELDNPHLIEVFTEVSILERCKGDRRVTQLFDYGCTTDSYYIVMEYYPMTLKSWRKSQKKPNLAEILRIYREFLKAATVLLDNKVNHYDIKCDNVMLDIDGMPALADFGESMSYTNECNCYSMLNKGTEWIKSPEMLSIAINSAITNPNYDRRRKVGAGPASDVWSIGCLFYELVTGEFLFADNDWSRFFLRITDPKETLLMPENLALLPEDPNYARFLEFVLQRNVRRRANLGQVIVKFDEIFPDAKEGPLPVITMPVINES